MGDLIKLLGAPNSSAKILNIKIVKDDSARIAVARSIWKAAGPICGTEAESYLRSRGITIPLPPTLRYHPGLRSVEPPFKQYGALVAAMTKSVSRELRAVYVIYLQDGAKAPLERVKVFRGSPAGCSVHLAPLDGDSLTIAEGIETALSIIQMGAPYERTCAWAAGSTAEVVNFDVPLGIRSLHVGVDIDPPRPGQTMGAGEIAARKLVDRINRTRPEIETWLSWPHGEKDKRDFNDELMEEAG